MLPWLLLREPVPTLGLAWTQFRKAIAHYKGFGVDSTLWSTADTTEIETTLDDGCRMFYYPWDAKRSRSHQWSFMRPTLTLPTTADTADYELPGYVSTVIGSMFFSADEGGYTEVEHTSIGEVLRARQSVSTTGLPRMYALRPVDRTLDLPSGWSSQRFEVMMYPTPDDAYDLSYQAAVMPEQMTSTTEYPLGGAIHSQTLKEACLAASEMSDSDLEGPHFRRFQQLLAISIDNDNRLNPPSVGAMQDPGIVPFDVPTMRDLFRRATVPTISVTTV